jgi:hypothetical protein
MKWWRIGFQGSRRSEAPMLTCSSMIWKTEDDARLESTLASSKKGVDARVSLDISECEPMIANALTIASWPSLSDFSPAHSRNGPQP